MKKISATFIVVGLVLAIGLVPPQTVNLKAFYGDCIEQKIDECMQKATLIDARGENVQSYAQDAGRQVVFYQRHRESLMRQMVELEIGENQTKARYFLIKAYVDSTPTELAEKY